MRRNPFESAGFTAHRGSRPWEEKRCPKAGSKKRLVWLLEEHRTRKSFGPLPPRLRRGVEDAYAIQSLRQLLAGALARPRHKVYHFKVMQKMVELDPPFSPTLIIHRSTVALRYADYIHLGIECELAADSVSITGRRTLLFPAQIADAVAADAGVELVDDRHADYSRSGP